MFMAFAYFGYGFCARRAVFMYVGYGFCARFADFLYVYGFGIHFVGFVRAILPLWSNITVNCADMIVI